MNDHNDIRDDKPEKAVQEPRLAPGSSERGAQKYHHGALREALLTAGEQELRERGIEGFSLRSVAKRAGVSHAAPAHHFRDANGLLTALATIGFQRFVERQVGSRSGIGGDPKAIMAASGLAYVGFAEEHAALFKLMFSSDRLDWSDPELGKAAGAAYDDLKTLAATVVGNGDGSEDAEAVGILTVWGMAHGLATLMTSGQLLPVGTRPAAEREALIASVFARIAR